MRVRMGMGGGRRGEMGARGEEFNCQWVDDIYHVWMTHGNC